MAAKRHDPVRWSVWSAAMEFGVTMNKVARGLKSLGIAPGKDGKYTTKQVASAIFGCDGLEQKAKEARWRGQIAEAELKQLRRDELKGSLVAVDLVKKRFADFAVTLMQKMRNSSLKDSEKKQFAAEL